MNTSTFNVIESLGSPYFPKILKKLNAMRLANQLFHLDFLESKQNFYNTFSKDVTRKLSENGIKLNSLKFDDDIYVVNNNYSFWFADYNIPFNNLLQLEENNFLHRILTPEQKELINSLNDEFDVSYNILIDIPEDGLVTTEFAPNSQSGVTNSLLLITTLSPDKYGKPYMKYYLEIATGEDIGDEFNTNEQWDIFQAERELLMELFVDINISIRDFVEEKFNDIQRKFKNDLAFFNSTDYLLELIDTKPELFENLSIRITD